MLAIGHSSTNRILVCVALGLPVREFRQRFVQGQANITVLRFEARRRPLGCPTARPQRHRAPAARGHASLVVTGGGVDPDARMTARASTAGAGRASRGATR